MAGAADTQAMTETDPTLAAERQRLERMLALFPGEVASAARLATEQANEMAALMQQTP